MMVHYKYLILTQAIRARQCIKQKNAHYLFKFIASSFKFNKAHSLLWLALLFAFFGRAARPARSLPPLPPPLSLPFLALIALVSHVVTVWHCGPVGARPYII